MFNLDQAISEWRRKMLASGLGNTEVLNELESHLRDDMAERTLSGLGVEEAFKRAVEQIGEATSLRYEFAKAAVARGSILQKLVTIVVIANFIFGAFAVFGGVAAIVSAYNVRMQGVHFEANDWWYLRASWSLSVYGAICGFIGIIAAKRLFKRQRSGMRLGIIWALATCPGILADALLRSWIYSVNGSAVRLDFVALLFALYPIMFVLLCRNPRLKEQYV